MAMPRKLPIEFGIPFPHGAFAVGEVLPVRDYDRSTKETVIQATDPDSGLPLWAVEVVDADPDATKATRTWSVKIAAKVQPVMPPASDGVPFRPVEFDRMTATAYVEDNGSFQRIAWSLRAGEMRAPTRGTKLAADKAA